MKLINLLIRELDNCSSEGVFRVSRHAEICQFYRFSTSNYMISRAITD